MKKYHLATFLVSLETLSSDTILIMEITALLSAYYAFCIIRITQSHSNVRPFERTFEYTPLLRP